MVYSEELRLTYVQLTKEDWGEEEYIPNIDEMEFYPYKLKEEDWKWQ